MAELITKADSPERPHTSSSSKRKQKKYRYKRQGHNKYDRDDARRVEARTFLSSITLDTYKGRSPASGELEDVEVTILSSASPSALRRKPNVPAQVMEEGRLSGGIQLGEQRLHEMAADMFNLRKHSPLKMTSSRSHEHDFEHIPPNLSSPLVRSMSLFDPNVSYMPSLEQKKISLQQMGHSRSMGSTGNAVGGGHSTAPGLSPSGVGVGPDAAGQVHYCGTIMKWPYDDCRYSVVISGGWCAIYRLVVMQAVQ